MAKGHKRSSKEIRKPNQAKPAAAPVAAFGKQVKDLADNGKKGGAKS